MNTAARLECQPVESDPQRAIEVINRKWCPQQQDIWATRKGTAQSVQSKKNQTQIIEKLKAKRVAIPCPVSGPELVVRPKLID